METSQRSPPPALTEQQRLELALRKQFRFEMSRLIRSQAPIKAKR